MIRHTSLLLLLTIITTAISDSCRVAIQYKEWFFYPSKAFTTGFPLKDKSAHDDAYDRYGSFHRMRAHGIIRFYEENGKIRHQQDSLYFYYDPNESGIPSTALIPVDSFSVTKGHKIFLFSTDTTNRLTNTSLVSPCTSTPWTKENERPGYIYGHGMIGLSYYDHVGSWVEAESDAIHNLLDKSAVLVASQQRSTDTNLSETYRYEYDLLLEDLTIERRWINVEDWSVHVIISARENKIAEPQAGHSATDPLNDSAIGIISNRDTVETGEQHTSEESILPISSPSVKVGSPEWYKLLREAQKKSNDQR